MEQPCCSINVTELENGFRVEVKGDGLKEKCKERFAACCTAERLKQCLASCCGK